MPLATTQQAPWFSDQDLYLWTEGTFRRAYEKLGAHPTTFNGKKGTHFAVWAPAAAAVSVVGPFNGWKRGAHPLAPVGAGIWAGFIPGVGQGMAYKYAIRSQFRNFEVEKADPFGHASEPRPGTASIVWPLNGHSWGDAEWMATRAEKQAVDAPMSVYELHLGSWRRHAEGNRWKGYHEVADELAAWVSREGFTHVELMPMAEHPFDGSWGYQGTGYFAATSRFGAPEGLMHLVDALHRKGIGVILDWVPAHFPRDEHGLVFFDGTHCFEHADPRQGLHPHWNTAIFNYGRREVAGYLISNALFWLDKYHIDGLRVDAVASMLYLDYGKEDGGWVANMFGGRENLEAIAFLRRTNEIIAEEYPGVVTMAEESTAWPKVTAPPSEGGLGFTFKWNMGWMHDMLKYMASDPLFRKGAHHHLTFSMMYNYAEKYVLPFSHDEVVHLKKSMLGKMPGDDWQRFANLRLLYGYQWGHPGKKLLFMGQEFGQHTEWNHDVQLPWELLAFPGPSGVAAWVADLNRLLKSHPELSAGDFHPWGFHWLSVDDAERSIVAFVRYPSEAQDKGLAFVCNFTPVVQEAYMLAVPWAGAYREILNSDEARYAGSGVVNPEPVEARPLAEPYRDMSWAISLRVPPLGVTVWELPAKPKPPAPKRSKASAKANAKAVGAASPPQGKAVGKGPSPKAKAVAPSASPKAKAGAKAPAPKLPPQLSPPPAPAKAKASKTAPAQEAPTAKVKQNRPPQGSASKKAQAQSKGH